MKRRIGIMVATGVLWLALIIVPLLSSVMQWSLQDRYLEAIYLLTLLFSLLLILEWYLVYHCQRVQKVAVRGGIESASIAALESSQTPMLMASHDGEIRWCNDMFRTRFTGGRTVDGHLVQDVIHLNLTALEKNRELLMEHDSRSYRVHAMQYIQDNEAIVVVQFTEITDVLRLQDENSNAKPCIMLVVIDGYDDLLQYARESEKAAVSAQVERVLDAFIAGTDGVIRKVEKDLFYIILETRHLHRIMNDRFHVLDEARQIKIGDRMHVTFSIGVADGATTLAESEKFARQALDMALGRGGDQAAVKTEGCFSFFGGASKGVEKKSKTRIRSMALALQELIENSDQIFLMGHHFGDLDSIGAACGLAGAIGLMQKNAAIVVDRNRCLASGLIDRMLQEKNAPVFISPEEAMHRLTEQTLLIVVDTHNKDILESPQLYAAAKTVVVIDHHRKNVGYIENAVIFHHEPYASSTSEMVTEILQYFRLDTEISAAYADALLAGIMLDTKNFVMRTGVRTFEAAAYLRKIGADTIAVKTLFSNTISMYSMRAEIVSAAEIYRNYAISAVKIGGEDGRVLASQAADELLSIQDVAASFVLYPIDNGTAISARSMGSVNVQVIMEKIHGGGHQTMAATQLVGVGIQEAKEELLRILEAYQ